MSSNNTTNNKSIKYGKMPVKKYKKANKKDKSHFHIIVDKNDDSYYSVGLTSDKPYNKKNQKLHKVFESNGKVARLKRSVTIDKIKVYTEKNASFTVDIDTENKALIMVENKKGKYK